MAYILWRVVVGAALLAGAKFVFGGVLRKGPGYWFSNQSEFPTVVEIKNEDPTDERVSLTTIRIPAGRSKYHPKKRVGDQVSSQTHQVDITVFKPSSVEGLGNRAKGKKGKK